MWSLRVVDWHRQLGLSQLETTKTILGAPLDSSGWPPGPPKQCHLSQVDTILILATFLAPGTFANHIPDNHIPAGVFSCTYASQAIHNDGKLTGHTVLHTKNHVYVYGGVNEHQSYHAAVTAFDTTTRQWGAPQRYVLGLGDALVLIYLLALLAGSLCVSLYQVACLPVCLCTQPYTCCYLYLHWMS